MMQIIKHIDNKLTLLSLALLFIDFFLSVPKCALFRNTLRPPIYTLLQDIQAPFEIRNRKIVNYQTSYLFFKKTIVQLFERESRVTSFRTKQHMQKNQSKSRVLLPVKTFHIHLFFFLFK